MSLPAEFGLLTVVLCGLYVALLLALGIAARRALRERTLSDFFLADRSIGFLVLLFTLFATQYSGNSLAAFPGQTHREGASYYMVVTFMVAIVTGYLLFAPRLFRIARRELFVTPTDFLAHRFGNPALDYLSAVVFAVTLVNYLLAQLMALGHAFSGLTGGAVPYATAVVGGAVVIVAYEILGGLRAVAWTDAVQGVLLAGGFLVILVLLIGEVGTPGEVLARVGEVAPEKVAPPSPLVCAVWASTFFLLLLAAPLYPHAIQRVYAARGPAELRRAFAVMAWLPHLTLTAVVFVGLAGIALFPRLEGVEADEITFRVLGFLVEQHAFAWLPVLVVMMAVVAAIMSTADSALLSLSSIFARDFVGRLRGLGREEAEGLYRLAPVLSVGTMAVVVLLAVQPLITLWGLLILKFEILIQMSPAFVLGTLHDRDHPRAFRGGEILAGLVAGLALAVGLNLAGHATVAGVHAGVLGVAVNYLLVVAGRGVRLARRA